jgi:Pyruvate/2-oxoacid:ferredoxin oxidoreductase delta subunit
MEENYTQLTKRMGYPESDRLLSILRMVMDPAEVELIISLPDISDNLAVKLGKPTDEINRMLKTLFDKGLIFMTSKGYQFARNLTQLHDATCSDARLDKRYGTKFLDLWNDFCQAEWFPEVARIVQKQEKPSWRIIPAGKAVSERKKLQPAEDLQEILNSASRFAVVNCPCRRASRTCKRPLEVCLQLNRGAEYAITRGHGKELTREQALAVLDKAESGGLIHTVPNIAGVASVICNCCPDCCILLQPPMKYGGLGKSIAKSRFQAEVETDLCTGCQVCTKRCQFGAIEIIPAQERKKVKAVVAMEKCFGCGLCVSECKSHAIKLVEVRPVDWD